jgi:hypothetical protein
VGGVILQLIKYEIMPPVATCFERSVASAPVRKKKSPYHDLGSPSDPSTNLFRRTFRYVGWGNGRHTPYAESRDDPPCINHSQTTMRFLRDGG